jgi:hypothetical protein
MKLAARYNTIAPQAHHIMLPGQFMARHIRRLVFISHLLDPEQACLRAVASPRQMIML